MAGIPAPSHGEPDTSADGTAEQYTVRSFAFEWDRRTDALWRSPSCAEILGLAEQPTEPSGEAYLARVHPADRERFARRIRRLTPSAPSYHLIYRVRRPDGDTVLLEEQGRGTFDPAGHLVCVTGFAAEATVARPRHHPLRDEAASWTHGTAKSDDAPQPGVDSEAPLRFALAAAEVGIWTWDLGTGEMAWSPESYALYGLNPAHGPPTPAQWLHCLHRGDREAVNEALWDAVEGRAPEFRAEFRVVHPARGVRWLLARGRLERDLDKVMRRLTGIHLDISERRAAEEALRESEERYRLVAQYTYDWEYWMGPDRRLRYVSPSCACVTGWTVEDFIADPGLLLAVVHPEDRPEIQHRIEEGFTSETLQQFEFRLVRRDGALRWIEHACGPVYGMDGRFAGRRASNRDITERKHLEEALRRREREYQTLAQNAPDIIARLDRDLRHVYVNAAVSRATGRLPEEFLGKTNEELGMPAELCRQWSDTFREVFRTGRPRSIDFDFPAPGGRRHYSVRAVPEFGPDGFVETVLSIARDETARRRIEQALEDSRARLERVITGSQDGYWEWHFGAGEVWVSARWNQIVGRLAAEGPVPVEDVERLVHPDDLPKLMAAATPILEGHRGTDHYELEYRFRCPDGSGVWVHSRARVTERDAQGMAVIISGLITDITLRKRIEQALRESESQFRSMFDLASVGMIQAEPASGRFLRVNAHYCQLTGYSAEELVGMSCWQITHPEDRGPTMAQYQCLVCGELSEYLVEKRYVRKDGAVIWVLVNATIIRDGEGKPLRTVAVVVDMTARRQAEEALREADRRKNEFLAMLGHELRNPLAPIRNAAEVMRLLDPREPRLRWAQEVIERQVKHLTRLVDDLLDLSRIVRGKIVLKREPLLLVRLADQALDEVHDIMDRHGHRLAVTLPEEPVWLDADPVRLGQVLVNLLHNAAKYTPDGGDIHLRAEAAGAEVVIRIRDTGRGIAPALLPHVFDLFAQGEQPLDRRQGGLGIGLTVVRQLVELHGGRVSAASAGPDRGSEFTVWLPRHAPTEASVAAVTPVVAVKSQRILVVDDDRSIADTTVMWLQLRGYDVAVARNGQAALDLALRFRPDVVLLDIGLPDMDGYQVARRLRGLASGQAVLLVAVTGYGHQEALHASRAAGFDHHLVKPVDPQALVALLG